MIRAAATAPCGSGRSPNPATGAVVATPPTGGNRGVGVGSESVTTAGKETAESSELTGTWPVVFSPMMFGLVLALPRSTWDSPAATTLPECFHF